MATMIINGSGFEYAEQGSGTPVIFVQGVRLFASGVLGEALFTDNTPCTTTKKSWNF